jgi:Reverse transcriptase (RNA-dependent DNA polymerase)
MNGYELNGKWKDAINLELNKMHLLKVWHVVNKNEVPKDRRYIKCKWVFDVKMNCVFRARLVACGYSQIPGVDFQDYYSPVVNDTDNHPIIMESNINNIRCRNCISKWRSRRNNIHGCTNIKQYLCVQLDKAMCGLVSAARQFYIKFSTTMKKLGFTVSYADPCLFYRHNKLGRIYMVVHIDDCYDIGDNLAIKELIKELFDQGLKCKVSPEAVDYLRCDIKID